MEPSQQWITPTQLFEEYKFALSTQAKYRMERKIPFSKVGRYIRYNRDEINQWLADHAMKMK